MALITKLADFGCDSQNTLTGELSTYLELAIIADGRGQFRAYQPSASMIPLIASLLSRSSILAFLPWNVASAA
jgi:hypothetical protein